MTKQTTNPRILDTVTDAKGNHYDVYGSIADSPLEERTHKDFDDPDGFPCRCGATNCPDGGVSSSPYL